MNGEFFKKYGRYAVCVLLVVCLCLLFEGRLFQWQILEGARFEAAARSDRTDIIELDAARGELKDRNGQVLAGNRTTYDVILNKLNLVTAQQNATILKIVDLLEERGEAWRDVLPVALNRDPEEEGVYRFLEDRESDVRSLKNALSLAEYATADQCVAELAELYDCRGYSTEDTRTVVSVRYGMTRDSFSRTNPYILARDVSADTVGVVSQRGAEWPGVEARVSVTRYYGTDGSLAPHVVGVVGDITGEIYESALESGAVYDPYENISGYKMNDVVGRAGLEAYFEDQLRGTRGEETIATDENGRVESVTVTTAPREGNTVVTTLDSGLQRAADISLAYNIRNNTTAANCTRGAAVVLDVKDFGVLACASYPDYDLNDYFTRYSELYSDPDLPLVNNALASLYVPGSVFKPLVAISALQEGAITVGTTYMCEGVFDYYDMHLGCLDKNPGPKNVYSGLAESCNVYFANVGLDVGIDIIDSYAEYFGLGEKTGVELYEETGIVANREDYSARHGGAVWTDGVTAMAAIGQSDNMFTPIQLAAYAATIATGGKRMQTHFLKEITDYTGEQVLETYQPKLLYDAGLSPEVLAAVREGMMGSASYGTARTVFGDYPVAIACKTGTAQNDENDNIEPNLSFICYAPANDPEIAVAVMLQYGNDGNWAKNVAKDILDQYFGFYTWDEEGYRYDAQGNRVDREGKLLVSREDLEAQRALAEQQAQEAFLASPSPSPAALPTPAPSPTPAANPHDGTDIPSAPYAGEPATPAPAESPAPGASPPAASEPPSPYYTAPADSPVPAGTG